MDFSTLSFLQDSYHKLINGMGDGLGNYIDELALVLNEKEDKELKQNFETLTHTNGNDLHILQPFYINSSASAYNSKILETASNISPEKYSLSESSESESSFEHNNNGKKTKPNETSTPKTNKKKRNVKKAYIENAQERASVKYLRLKGLKKKIDLFDTLTASKSIDFAKNVSSDEDDSINNKTIHKYKHIKRKENIDPAKLKTNKEKSSHQASKNKKNLKN
jgi:hypothetical protein